jgi:hypothetical protein
MRRILGTPWEAITQPLTDGLDLVCSSVRDRPGNLSVET